MKLVRQLSGSSQGTSVTARSKRLQNKANAKPVETPKTNNKDGELIEEVNTNTELFTENTLFFESKIVVPAEKFNNFEEVLIKSEAQNEDTNNDKTCEDNNVNQRKNSTRNSNKNVDRGTDPVHWKNGELNKEVNTNTELITENTLFSASNIVVTAETFNNFEAVQIKKEKQNEDTNNDKSCEDNNVNQKKNSTRNSNKNVDRGTDPLHRKNGELNKEVNTNTELITENTLFSASNIVVPAETFNNFEAVQIKKEKQNRDTNNDNSCDDNNVNQKVVGGIPDASNGLLSVQSSSTAGNVTKASSQGKRVFIIKSVSGKSFTLIPRTTPVVLAKENGENKLVNSAVKLADKTSSTFVNNVTSRVPIVNDKLKPQTSTNVTKSIRDNSQCISRQTSTQILKLTNVGVPNTMPKINKFKDITTSDNLNGNKRFSIEDINEMPMYVDNETQTDDKLLKDCSVQTEVYIPSPARSVEELPNITDLVEYLLETPKYSNGLDEIKKSDLLGMSKNIIMKGNVNLETTATKAISKSNMSENLKTQLFLDLKNCLTLDFLGNMPIHNAILESSTSLLKRQCFALKLRQMSINIVNNQGLTPLQLAIVNGCDSQILTVLLENGADVNIKDSEGNTTVHLTVLNSTDYNLSLILEHSNQSKNNLINCKNDDGLTPLMLAAIESKADMVDILLKNGADPNLRDEKSGRTALFHAVEVNSNFVINLLLKYRADPRIRNFFGLTVLDAAKDLDMQDVVLLESNDIPSPSVTINVNKRAHNVKSTGNNSTKKSKLSFIPSYQRVELSTIQKCVRKKVVVHRQ